MNRHRSTKLLLIIFSVLFGATLPAQAQTEAALLASMEARLPELMDLKLSGMVGETNRALVEARQTLRRAERRLIADENRDRTAHYNLIAQRLGIAVAVVQQKRAEQIRQSSPKGIWIQSDSGDWYRE